jgi:pantothenate kinase type III
VLGGRAPVVLLTGGGAKAVAALVRTRYRAVPDLVLQGLAVLASEAKSDS